MISLSKVYDYRSQGCVTRYHSRPDDHSLGAPKPHLGYACLIELLTAEHDCTDERNGYSHAEAPRDNRCFSWTSALIDAYTDNILHNNDTQIADASVDSNLDTLSCDTSSRTTTGKVVAGMVLHPEWYGDPIREGKKVVSGSCHTVAWKDDSCIGVYAHSLGGGELLITEGIITVLL